ncbi:MAG TPA: PHP domain-containing protein [Candidatus Limnocylindria bacterium]|nr:PHP domain-containing protein [Candidatus Limnocylindria bacterium]
MIPEGILGRLNAPDREERLINLAAALREADFPPRDPRYINNHIHTTYSFSPYSPTAAVYAALAEGLCTAGIVDHDSIGGAREFLRAGEIAGLPVTVGIEARVSLKGTPLEHRHTNSPDQAGLAYMVLHAVPHGSIGMVQEYFAPVREKRNARNRRMLEAVNRLAGTDLDFGRDVLPLSMAHDGGSVTERHLMLALARSLNPGMGMMEEFRRVGELKKDFIPRVYEDADEELPRFHEYVDFCKKTGGILAYPYLGDVGVSVTGDKRAQKFEDEYLDELFALLDGAGIRAVTYMPTRNTFAQLDRLRALCARYGMMEISGEDINTPAQSFVIKKMEDPRFAHLIDSTWDLIRHENGGNIQ